MVLGDAERDRELERAVDWVEKDLSRIGRALDRRFIRSAILKYIELVKLGRVEQYASGLSLPAVFTMFDTMRKTFVGPRADQVFESLFDGFEKGEVSPLIVRPLVAERAKQEGKREAEELERKRPGLISRALKEVFNVDLGKVALVGGAVAAGIVTLTLFSWIRSGR